MNKKTKLITRKRTPKDFTVDLRRQQVLGWHESGMSIREIAVKLVDLGYKISKSTVKNDLQAVYTSLKDEGLDYLQMMRARQTRRLDALIGANWDKALAGDERAAKIIKDLMNAQSDLLGLKAATKFEHGGAVPLVAMTLEEWRAEQTRRRAEAAETAGMFE